MLPFKIFILALSSAIIPITVGLKNITINAPAPLPPTPFRFPQYPPFPVPFPGLMPGAAGIPPVPFGTPLISSVPGAKAAPMQVTPFFPPFFPGMFPPIAPPSQPLISPKLPKGAQTPVVPSLPFGPFPPFPLPPGPPVAPLAAMGPPPPPPGIIPAFGPMKMPMGPVPVAPPPTVPIPIGPVPMGGIPLTTVPVPQPLPILPTSDNYYCSAFASIAVSQATTLKSPVPASFVAPPPVAASRDDDVDVGIARMTELPPLPLPLSAPIESRQYCRYTAVTSPDACTTCCKAAAHFGPLHAESVKGLLLLFDPEKPAVSSIDVGIAARKRRSANLFANGPPISKNAGDKRRYQCMCCAPRVFIDYQY